MQIVIDYLYKFKNENKLTQKTIAYRLKYNVPEQYAVAKKIDVQNFAYQFSIYDNDTQFTYNFEELYQTVLKTNAYQKEYYPKDIFIKVLNQLMNHNEPLNLYHLLGQSNLFLAKFYKTNRQKHKIHNYHGHYVYKNNVYTAKELLKIAQTEFGNTNLKLSALRWRLGNGWTVEHAIKTPMNMIRSRSVLNYYRRTKK